MIWGGSPAKIIKAAEAKKISILISEEILGEINQTLVYPRLKQIYEEAGVNRVELMEIVMRKGKLIEVLTKVDCAPEDPSDNKFIECASAGEADYVVSGDKHLLKIGNYKKIKILPVNEFLKTLKECNNGVKES